MAYNPEIHHRRSIRLQGYDYSQSGAYFVTICTFQRQHLFGEVNNGEMQLNVTGQIISAIWQKVPQHFPNVELDQFILMPDHLHGIIVILEQADTLYSLATIIQNFKSSSARKINKINQNLGVSIWQRNYHERIIRNDQELHLQREYVLTNPENWQF
ncbi:transposase [Synechococcus sp. BA-132 BA5]|uniref:transposase n=1 Tax=Synechococcus sp. BA-132 BA5 TaxID=3110252 RepID=UPI002B20276F|nr:transposase [Synechococcus sp. BA-132 BA5]MEA5417544.1 transposase [Synechococcus sp. BA-132 BA5]